MPKKRNKGKASIPLNPVIHIFCEGEKTEPSYIKGYIDKFFPGINNKGFKVIDVKNTKKNTPRELVNEACKLRASSTTPSKDSVWVVYDREATAKYEDRLHQEAIDKARAKNISVALSNVCFELWLLLHFQENNAQYSSCDDLLRKSNLKKHLNDVGINNYEKSFEGVFEKINGNIELAITRADRMNRSTLDASQHDESKPHMLNPYTNIGALLADIDRIANENKTKKLGAL
ncbi:RloB family protein [Thioclava sp.]|uniref:RloB family protein n=1 Tax=Thioclava sp. TaxID=1933450 RepID=UPI003AA9122A